MRLIDMPASPAPRIAWEIIERVIDHCADNGRTLYSLIRTCSNLRPRGTIVLFSHVKPKTRDQLFTLCAVLQANPHLRPCVLSVSIPALEFSPHPFLRMLPNLSDITFNRGAAGDSDRTTLKHLVTFHASVLKFCRQFGQHICTLSLHDLKFSSPSTFSDILLSLSNIRSLSCSLLSVKKGSVHQGLIARRRLNRLHLSSLTIGYAIDAALLNLLREAAFGTITTLSCALDVEGDDSSTTCEHFNQNFVGSPSDWVQLTSITWRVPLNMSHPKPDVILDNVAAVVTHFYPPNLCNVTVESRFSRFCQFLRFASKPSAPKLCAELENIFVTLLPRPTVSFSVYYLSSIQRDMWMHRLEGLFPALAEHHALKVVADKYSVNSGHAGEMHSPIVTSADSRWAATGSSDGTIILWDLQRECISQQWYAVENGPDSLAFSPNGRYLISASRWAAARGKAATIWDLHQGARPVISLEGEGGSSLSSPHCINCIWAPDGSWVAVGAQLEGTVHIWETTTGTFQRRHDAVLEGSELLAVSNDGRWMVTGILDSSWARKPEVYHCWIWSVESGQVHRSLQGHTDQVNAAAFNSEGTRLATGSKSSDFTLRIWDTESGEQLLVMRDLGSYKGVDAVAFSGDGRMVLSHSYGLGSRHRSSLADGVVKVWDASNGTLLVSLSEACDEVCTAPQSACFSPCGGYLASASNESSVLLWRTSDWACIAEVSGWSGVGEVSWWAGQVTNVAFSPDGTMLCLANLVGMVLFRRMQDIIPPN